MSCGTAKHVYIYIYIWIKETKTSKGKGFKKLILLPNVSPVNASSVVSHTTDEALTGETFIYIYIYTYS